jgi:IclR family KDG regulon transcriptional repressor
MSYTVEALQDALGVLRVVAQHPGLGVSEIGRRAGFTKARTFRFLATFEAAGIVQRGRDGVSYHLGPAALVIGLAAQEQVSLTQLAEKPLDALVAKYNETAAVLVRDGLESVAVAQKNSTHEVRVHGAIGRRRPLHAGASGKVLLAFGPENIETRMLEGELPKVAPQTITSKARLKKELQRTREQGYATSLSEGAVDVVAIAAPVYGSAGLVVASIGLSMPSSRAPEDLSGMARTVCAAARQLSTDLGWVQDATVQR